MNYIEIYLVMTSKSLRCELIVAKLLIDEKNNEFNPVLFNYRLRRVLKALGLASCYNIFT